MRFPRATNAAFLTGGLILYLCAAAAEEFWQMLQLKKNTLSVTLLVTLKLLENYLDAERLCTLI